MNNRMTLNLKESQNAFTEFIEKVDSKVLPSFFEWIRGTYCHDECSDDNSFIHEANSKLRQIADHIKLKIPQSGELDSENILWPQIGYDADCNPTNTVHIDCFLFDDEELDRMTEEGKISRNYCLECGSKKTRSLTFISHSLSIPQFEYIFTALVPLCNQKQEFHVVDIGSRLGGMCAAAHFYSNGKARVTGIEMNEELCRIQEDLICTFNLSSFSVVHADVRTQSKLLESANLVVMNNVFGFFQNVDDQISCWTSIYSSLKPGTILIHNPSVEEVTAHLDLSFTIDDWLRPIKILSKARKMAGNDESLFEDLSTLHMYKVRDIPIGEGD